MSTRIQQLKDIYSRLPALNCAGLCHGSCGPIALSALEAKRAYKAGNVLLGLKFLRPDATLLQPCKALDQETKLCTIYDVRPLICRLYGMAEGLRCEHGCVPEREVTKEEARALLQEVMALGGEQK